MVYLPGLKNTAWRFELNSPSVEIESSLAWTTESGVLGSKIVTFGPKFGVEFAGPVCAAIVFVHAAPAMRMAPIRRSNSPSLAIADRRGPPLPLASELCLNDPSFGWIVQAQLTG